MDIASEYSLYLEKRKSNAMLQSKAEGLCSYCISYLGIKKDFVLLFDKQDHFVYCFCHYVPNTKEPTKPFFYIDIPQSFKHNIRKLLDENQLNDIDKVNTLFYRDSERHYSFDEYYNQFLPEGFIDKLRDAIKELPTQKECPIIVSGPLASHYSFMYVLQDKFEEVGWNGGTAMMTIGQEITPRCYFPPEMKQSVNLFVGTSIVKYTLENLGGKGIAIPLDEETLNSTFWKDVTWRNVASVSEQIDGEIAGIPIRYVGLKLIVDGYRNIFLSIKNGEKNYKTILLQNVHNTVLSTNENEKANKKIVAVEKQYNKEIKVSTNNNEQPISDGKTKKVPNSLTCGILVIDSNVFIDCPNILKIIAHKYPVCVPAAVIDELNYKKDNHKEEQVRKHARWAIKNISNDDSVELTSTNSKIPKGWDYNMRDNDNKIVLVAYNLLNRDCMLITSDEGMILKAKEKHIPFIKLADFLKYINNIKRI